MGTRNKNQVQLVISHLEGCSGNFLGRLFADNVSQDQTLFRVDTNQHPQVLSIDGYANWSQELAKLKDQIAVVTHNFDLDVLQAEFPEAKIVQIYPYTHIGNVLYNVCFKKLDIKIPNHIDNHLIHIREWYQHIVNRRPKTVCTNYWDLTDQDSVENLLGIKFTDTQHAFFTNYWRQQLDYQLCILDQPKSIQALLEQWKCTERFDDWFAAWAIFVYELTNGKSETDRVWSIDTTPFTNWADVIDIETKYHA